MEKKNVTSSEIEKSVSEEKKQSNQNVVNEVGNEELDKTKKIAIDLNALKGVVSGKDKVLNAIKLELEELKTSRDVLEKKLEVKDLLINSKLPTPVKEALQGEVSSLTPDNFDDKAKTYNQLYQKGLDDKTQRQSEAESIEIDVQKNMNIQEKISEAKTPEEVLDLIN